MIAQLLACPASGHLDSHAALSSPEPTYSAPRVEQLGPASKYWDSHSILSSQEPTVLRELGNRVQLPSTFDGHSALSSSEPTVL